MGIVKRCRLRKAARDDDAIAGAGQPVAGAQYAS